MWLIHCSIKCGFRSIYCTTKCYIHSSTFLHNSFSILLIGHIWHLHACFHVLIYSFTSQAIYFPFPKKFHLSKFFSLSSLFSLIRSLFLFSPFS
jgi:hypothetical protein